jgi:hypothetical protein
VRPQLGHVRPQGQAPARRVRQARYIEKYIPTSGCALQEILDLSDGERDTTVSTLDDVLQKSRKF